MAAMAGATLGAPQPEAPVFRSTTNLVEISVVALDKKGLPVVDLKPEQIHLLVDGHARRIAFLRYEGNAAAESAPVRVPPHVYSNRAELYSGPARGVAALVLDDLNTEVSDQRMVKAQALHFLRELAPVSRVAVYQVGTEFRVLHDYTDDLDLLRSRLRGLKPAFASRRMSEVNTMAEEAEAFLPVVQNPTIANQIRTALVGELNYNAATRAGRVASTLAAMEAVGRHLAGISGRKSVVWIGGGFALTAARASTRRHPGEIVSPAVGDDFYKPVAEAARRLAQLGIVLYLVDARGLQSPADNLSSQQYLPSPAGGMFGDIVRADAWSSDPRAAASLLASTTGGRYITNSNDFSEGVRRAVNDARGAYTIAFYAGEPADDRWHTLKLSTSVPGVDLIHRQSFLLRSGREPDWSGDRLRRQLLSPLGSSAIRLTARCAPDRDGLHLAMQIEAEDLSLVESAGRLRGELEITIGDIGAKGEVHYAQQTIRLDLSPAQFTTARDSGIPYRRTWTPAKGTIAVRILVRQEGTDRFGVLTANVAGN